MRRLAHVLGVVLLEEGLQGRRLPEIERRGVRPPLPLVLDVEDPDRMPDEVEDFHVAPRVAPRHGVAVPPHPLLLLALIGGRAFADRDAAAARRHASRPT